MTTTTTTTPTSATATAKPAVRARIADARETAGDVGSALIAGGKAYAGGIMELGRALGGFGREIVTEAGDHVRATMKAKCLREVAELQAAYAQHRIEMSATHTKEFVDLARVKAEEAIAPIADLFKQDKAA